MQLVPFAGNEGYYKSQSTWAPRFSFAYSLAENRTSSIRGGIGLFFDRPEGNLYFPLVNNPPFALSSEFQNGNLANPGGGTVAPLAPWGTLDSLDPNFKIPRVWNWSIGYQQEFAWGLFGEVTYVGNRGQHLLRQPDINQPPLEVYAANAAGPNYATNYLRQYKGFSAINMRLSDAESSYHALQTFLSKRQGDFYFTASYTLSKAMDHNSSNTTSMPEGYQDLAYYWAPGDFDRRHIFVGTYKGDLTAANTISWLNPGAFAVPAVGAKGTSGRNAFTGPGYHAWDISLRKAFRVCKEAKIQVQADFFNAFNQENFNNPGQLNISNTGFGVITSALTPRQMQLGVRFLF